MTGWSEDDDAIIAGDLTAALAYVTPAGGAVVTPVAPIGLRDRDAGTVAFTTSLGFGRKLARIDANPRVALAYHAREHGFATAPRFVLVQGQASYDTRPDRAVLAQRVGPASARFMGPPRRGAFWDRWLSAYYADRVLVTVRVERVVSWPDERCAGEPSVSGAPVVAAAPASQDAPRGGAGPRVDVERAVRRVRSLPHVLIGHVDGGGFPMIAPVAVAASSPAGIVLDGPLPGGERRAGLLAHRYERQLVGLEMRQYTGWLHDRTYAPHTERAFRAPANKTLLLLGNGYTARRGLRRARAQRG